MVDFQVTPPLGSNIVLGRRPAVGRLVASAYAIDGSMALGLQVKDDGDVLVSNIFKGDA